MYLTYQYKLNPDRAQRRFLEHVLEVQRNLYNYCIQSRKFEWEHNQKTLGKKDQFKDLTKIRANDPEYKNLPANLSRWTIDAVEKAYKAFFRRVKNGEKEPGYPRYKGKGRFRSFGFHEWSGITLKENKISFNGLPRSLRVNLHRPIPEGAEVKSCTIGVKCDRWIISLQIEIADVALLEDKGDLRKIAIDLGRESIVNFQDGTSIPTQRISKRYENETKSIQRALSKSVNGSNSWKQRKLALSKNKRDEANARRTYLHQISAEVTRKADWFALDDLNVVEMTKSIKNTNQSQFGKNFKNKNKMNQSNLDAGYSMLNRMIVYKAAKAGKRTTLCDSAYTSQDCALCWARDGVVQRAKKSLSQREHHCIRCGFKTSRDTNAALNIYAKGFGRRALCAEMVRLHLNQYSITMYNADQGVVLLRSILIRSIDSLELLEDGYEAKGQEHQSDALASGETAGITLLKEFSGLILK